MEAEVIAISTDDLSGAARVVKALGLEFPILYDPDAGVVTEYGVYNLLGDRYATPATFVLDKDGNIRWQYIGTSKSDRPSNAAIFAKLREIN